MTVLGIEKIVDAAIASGDEIGVQVAAYVDGELVVDLAAGVADIETGAPLDEDTLIHAFSVGKGVAATVVARLVERGELGYDTPVAEYWPEFARHGKEKTTVGHVLSHCAGLASLAPDLTLETLCDQDAMAALLAGRTPDWEPGTATGYHAWTFGNLVAEIVRRATGRTIDEVLAADVAQPLGLEGSLFFSVPDDVKVARLHPGTWDAFLEGLAARAGINTAPPQARPVAAIAGNRGYLRAGVPCTATVTARGLAGMYAGLLSGKLVSPETLAAATKPRTADLGADRVFELPVLKSYGFFVADPDSLTAAGMHGFGMSGSGGSVGFADPERGVAFAFVHTRLTDYRNSIVTRILAELAYPG
jgi:CubicO group peptidase (beta-lactamase class C family)